MMVLLEHGVAHDVEHVHLIATREPGHRLGNSTWRLHQAFAIRILAHELEFAPNQIFKFKIAITAELAADLEGVVHGIQAPHGAGRVTAHRIRHSCSPFPRDEAVTDGPAVVRAQGAASMPE